jgi:hypothetical protein
MKMLLLGSLMVVSVLTSAETVNFDDAPAGRPPAGWVLTKTGQGSPRWTVEKDATAPSPPNVLKQSGEATYPIALREGTALKDGFVEVQFKAVAGKEDQAGGVIWRARDAANYYVARANALEDNVTIYHTIDGKRTEKKRMKMKVASNQWHRLRVEFRASQFRVSLDGQPALDWSDETFPGAGMVGLWTKADSVTLFDDFRYGK